MTGQPVPPPAFELRGLRGALLLYHLYQSCAFALVVLPVLGATRASGIAQFPEPARLLYSEGSLWLLELVQQQRSSLLLELGPSVWVFGCVCCLSIVPQWALLRAIRRQHSRTAAPGLPVLARLSALELIFWLLRIPAWFTLAALASLAPWLAALSDERSADLLLLGALAVVLLVQLGLSLLRDVAALGVVSGQPSALGISGPALRRAREHRASLAARYAALRALSLGSWLCGELLLFTLPSAISAHAGVGFAVHQLALLARIVLHAAWLAWLARQLEA